MPLTGLLSPAALFTLPSEWALIKWRQVQWWRYRVVNWCSRSPIIAWCISWPPD